MRRDVFQAIADPTRRDIIELLARKSMNLNSVADHFTISRPAISQQIKILEECGLIKVHQQGRERYCEANLSKLNDVTKWVNKQTQFWNQKLDALEKFLDSDSSKIKPKKK